MAVADPPLRTHPAWRGLRAVALALSFAGLLLVAAAGPSAARPGLGPRGWAPGALPLHLSSATVSLVLAGAYVLGAAAVGLGLLAPPPRAARLWWVLAPAALALLTAPFGSADHTNYAAYGRITAQGGDAYLVPPATWAGGHDPVTSAVEPPWTMTPSIYGPLATLLQALTSLVGGPNLRETVWVWQVLVVLAWLAVRALLLGATDDEPTRSRVDVLWTFNPLIFGVSVLGAHVDVIATALVLTALVLAARTPWFAGLALGAAVSTKVTYGVAAVAILWSWRRLEAGTWIRKAAALGFGALLVAVPLHWWAGPHVFDQLRRARRSVSLASPWRPVVEVLTGPLSSTTVRNLVFAASALVVVALAWLLSRAAGWAGTSRTGSAVRATFVLGTAYTLAAPYTLPWYDTLTWATLPALTATALDGVLLGRLLVMVLAYVPGRVVAMSAQVGDVTLGFRRHIAPYAGWLAWVAIALLARRAWRQVPRSRGPRPPASGR